MKEKHTNCTMAILPKMSSYKHTLHLAQRKPMQFQGLYMHILTHGVMSALMTFHSELGEISNSTDTILAHAFIHFREEHKYAAATQCLVGFSHYDLLFNSNQIF